MFPPTTLPPFSANLQEHAFPLSGLQEMSVRAQPATGSQSPAAYSWVGGVKWSLTPGYFLGLLEAVLVGSTGEMGKREGQVVS